MDATDILMGGRVDPSRRLMDASRTPSKAGKPYVPVKDKSASRKQWFEKKEISDRMRAMRVVLDTELKGQRDAIWARHTAARDALDKHSKAQVDTARESVKATYKPKWRNLYAAQRKEARIVDRLSGNLLDRPAFVYQNRERLGGARGPLSLKQMIPLIRSDKLLSKRVTNIHEQKRRALDREAKSESKEQTGAIWQRHKYAMTALRDRQSAERQSERDAQASRRQSVSFAMSKAALAIEHANAPRPFVRSPPPLPERRPMPPPERFREAQAPPPTAEPVEIIQEFVKAADPSPAAPLSRAEQIKCDMAAWRQRNQGKDFGREL